MGITRNLLLRYRAAFPNAARFSIFNSLENRSATGKARPAILVDRDGGQWHTLGLTTNATYREDFAPIDPDCACYACTNFTRAYLRHLFVAGELLAYRLATLHNLTFILGLMRRIRTGVKEGALPEVRRAFQARWRPPSGPETHSF